MLLGCIGDDFTGSSDLGLTLSKEGMRVTQYCGVPDEPARNDVDAGIVALKSRTIPADEAVAQSIEALNWLRDQGCQQYLFKYCSTFDSTPDGNIGPVIEALMKELAVDRCIVCPAFPATGRLVFQGHLFVNDRLLNESGMQHHPLTPMTDPDIRRWLALQTKQPIGHVAHADVTKDSASIRSALDREVAAGGGIVVVDAVSDRDLRTIGAACKDVTLVTGGSGIGLGLPANFGITPASSPAAPISTEKSSGGVVLSGSCSNATRQQVAEYSRHHPARSIDPADILDGRQTAQDIASWLMDHIDEDPILYSSADPTDVNAMQDRYGHLTAAETVEGMFSKVAQSVYRAGVRRIVVAGGETSGAVATALDLTALRIGREIAPGVPVLYADDLRLSVAFKSGNFGDPDFFEAALAALGGVDGA